MTDCTLTIECTLGIPLCYSYQFNFKDKCGAARNAWLRELAIAHLGRDVDFPFVADMHLLDGDDPALDEVAQAAGQRHATTAAVKLLTVDCPAGIVGCDDAAYRWFRKSTEDYYFCGNRSLALRYDL